MKSQIIVLAALAIAPLVLADIDFENVQSVEDPKVESRPTDARDFIGDLIENIMKKVAAPHIVGGYVVDPHSYPHQVAVIPETFFGKNRCGGSLIDAEWVLTAAHCTMDVENMTVILGSHNLSRPETSRQIIPVTKMITHPSWSSASLAYDIALLKLSKPAQLNEYVKTIRLPRASQRQTDLSNKTVEVIGWGRYTDKRSWMSSALRATETKIIPNRDCNRHYHNNIQELHICADGSQAKGACNGDSGGPMILKEADGERTIIGITSFGRNEGCEKLFPSVFTRVDSYLQWIGEKTGIKLRD